MARIITKIGDIFIVTIEENKVKYFQYVANDISQLNSSVIRAFKKAYTIDETPDLTDIVNDEIDFYAHVVLRWGIEKNLWKKIGKITEVGTMDILFRATTDYGRKAGEEPIRVSNNWYVWKINDQFKDVGKLEGENRKAEIGIVFTPNDIIERMKTGDYGGFYPDYE